MMCAPEVRPKSNSGGVSLWPVNGIILNFIVTIKIPLSNAKSKR